MLPMLGDCLGIKPQDVCACYIGDSYTSDFNGHILLIFHDGFLNQNKDSIINNELFIDSYIHIEYEKQIFVFDVPINHKDGFKKYLDGKYSTFPEDYKLEILAFHNIIDRTCKVFQVLYKDNELRSKLQKQLKVCLQDDQELSSKPDLNFEYFSITHFIETSKKLSLNSVEGGSNNHLDQGLSKVIGVNSDGTLIHLINNREIVGLRAKHNNLKSYDFNKIILFKTKPLKK